MMSSDLFRVAKEDLAADNNMLSKELGPTPKTLKATEERRKPISIMTTILRRGITMVRNLTIRPERSFRRITTPTRAVRGIKPPGKIGPKLKRKRVIKENRRPSKRTISNSRVREEAGSAASARIRLTLVRDSTIPELPKVASHSSIRAKTPTMVDKGLHSRINTIQSHLPRRFWHLVH